MTPEEVTKFPEALQKALPVKHRVLLFEFQSAPLEAHVVVHLRIIVPDGRIFETHIPFAEFKAPTEFLIDKVKRDLRWIMEGK